MKILLIVMSLLFSPLLLAHPGHGVEGLTHELVHFAWLLAAVSLGAFVLYKLPRAMKQKRKNR